MRLFFWYLVSSLPLITQTYSRYDWLAFPHNVDAAPNEAILRHPHREEWHRIGRHFRQHFQYLHPGSGHTHGHGDEFYSRGPRGTCRVQVVRSVSDWSHGVLTEHSIQNACKRNFY
jgi:phospholipase D1/2